MTITEISLPAIDESYSPSRSVSDTTEEDVAILKKWKEDCLLSAAGHQKAFRLYKMMNNVCTTLTIGLSACSGIIVIVLTASMFDPTMVLPIVSGTTSIVVGSILAAGKSMEIEKNMYLHEEHSAEFGEMARDIQVEHTLRKLGKSQYADLSTFITTISDRIDRLTMHAPSMPC